MKKLKIGYVLQPFDDVTPPHKASLSIISYELARRVAKGNDVYVFQRGFSKKTTTKEYESFKIYSIPVLYDYYLNKFLTKYLYRLIYKKRVPYYYTILFYVIYTFLISYYSRKLKIDVLHVANYANFAPILRFFNPNTKIILHMHCDWLNMMNTNIVNKYVKRIDHIVSVSNYIRSRFDKTLKTQKKSSTIYNGIDNKLFSNHVEKKSHIILYTGRISPEKGVHTLIESMPTVTQQFPNVKLLLFGWKKQMSYSKYLQYSKDPLEKKLVRFYPDLKTDSYYYNYLIKFVEENNLSNNIIFKDSIPNNELPRYYQESAIFICPSVWDEAFPMTALEAMSTGTPIISTKSGGLTESIRDKINGILIDKEDSQQLADSIIFLLSNRDILKKYGDNGRLIVENNYTWDRITANFVNLYQKLYNE